MHALPANNFSIVGKRLPQCAKRLLNEHLYDIAKRILTSNLNGQQHRKVLHWCCCKNDSATMRSQACANNSRQCSSRFLCVRTHGTLSAHLYVHFMFSSHHLGWRFLWCVYRRRQCPHQPATEAAQHWKNILPPTEHTHANASMCSNQKDLSK